MNFKVNALADSLKIDSAGHVTKPLQPAVLYSGNDEDNFTGDGTALRPGIDSGVGTTERFDVNADQNHWNIYCSSNRKISYCRSSLGT